MTAKTRSILVPTDFSERAESAFPIAQAEAQALRTGVELINVFRAPAVPRGGASVAVEQFFDEARRDAATRLAELAKKHFAGIETSTAVIDHVGHEGDAIVTHADKSSSLMIVIATHGGGVLRQMLVGSVAERVVRNAPCPVLTIPSGDARSFRNMRQPFQRIVVTTDLSPSAEGAFECAEEQARLFGAKISVVHVGGSPAASTENSPAAALERIVQRFGAHAEYTLIPLERSIPQSILSHADAFKADLIVIAAKGAEQSSTLGGVTEKIIHSATCPVLTARYHTVE